MPKQIKKRITKSSAVKEDDVRSTALRALDLIKEKRKHLLIVLSVVVLASVLYLALYLYNSSIEEKAYSLELDAYNYYYGVNVDASMTEEERWRKALELYKQSVQTKPTPMARFYLGNSYYKLGDYGNAVKEYNTFIQTHGDEEEILPVLYQKLASAYFKINQTDKAIETLGALARTGNGIFKDTAIVLEARHYETEGQSEKAVEKYRELVSTFPASMWTNEARSKIELEESLQSGEKKAGESPIETEVMEGADILEELEQSTTEQ
jgi:tetratricopeptide (TPR) repeat protein